MSRRPILLIGDVGVGKTMFQRHLIRIDAAGLMKNALSLYVNLGTQATLSSDLKAFLITDLERQLRESYGLDIFSSEFVCGVYDLDIKRFDKGIYGSKKESNPDLYELKKLEFLDAKLSDRVEHLKNCFRHISKGHRKQIVIFLDNADQREYEVQQEVFLISQEIAEHWHATVFLPIRPETFHRSKKKDALSGYHAKAFTISPPRIDEVIKKRLAFALRIANGEVPLVFANHWQLNTKFEAVSSLIRAFLNSFDHNRELAELLDNVSHGSVRLVLDLIQQFFGSGHVNTQKIYDAVRRDGWYLIPLHEFIRAVMFGDAAHYHPEQSPIANIFDISQVDPREHFLMPLLIGTVHDLKNFGKSEGFVEFQEVFTRLQRIGYVADQVERSVVRACEKKLLESPARRVPQYGQEMPQSLRATSVGIYHIHRLAASFTYHDAIVVDVPILSPPVSRQIRNVVRLEDRLGQGRIIPHLFG